MPPIFIDRRKNTSGKSTGKRTKFLKRVEDLIKEQIPNIINKRKIEDIDSEGGKVRVSRKTIAEPSFRNGKGGIREHVHSGNDRYITGDTSPRPPEEGGGGSGKKRRTVVKVRTILLSNSIEMNFSIYCSQIWNCQTWFAKACNTP